MLQTVRDTCELHPMALEYAMGDQIEHLSDLLMQTEKDAEEFFKKTFVTTGMGTLLRQGLQRLSGQSDQAVFELKQAMGGGKTHSMLCLGVLARNPQLAHLIPTGVTSGLTLSKAKVVAINGRSVSPEIFLWGDIADQLGKKEQFAALWKHVPTAPTESDWIELIGQEPTLILLDELPPYFDYATTRSVGEGSLANVTTFALSNLLSAALKLKNLCIVISNLSGTYDGASRQLTRAIRNFQAEANRQARAITPVELASDEVYQILRKRLFKTLPPKSVIEETADAFAAALSEAVKSKAIAKTPEQFAEEVLASYPFHPSVKGVVAMFKENESYRQTRGLMQFASKMLKSVWERKTNDVYLIGCQHLDMSIPDVREEVNRISNLQSAISTDIASNGSAHAEVVDANLGNDAASQVVRLLLTASLSESVDAVKGLTKHQVLEHLVAPLRSVTEFDTAFEAFRRESWYLHRTESDAWYFSNIENLRKRIEKRATDAPQPKIDEEMKRRLEMAFAPKRKIAYHQAMALPKLDDITLGANRVCLIISPDSKNPPNEAQNFFSAVTEKNSFCVVTGDGSSLGSLDDKVRRIWAIAKVRKEVGESSPHIPELNEEEELAEFDFNSTLITLFNRVYYPAKTPAGIGLAYVKLQLVSTQIEEDGKKKSIINGEDAVEQSLSGTAASKLKLDVQDGIDGLIQRAEDMLWHSSEKRIPWKDVVSRSISNARWVWLPPKGLEALRTTACGRDQWRFYPEDSQVEKGPFPPPKTAVSVAERDYDETTGKATLEITARDAGPNGRVHFAKTAAVSASSDVADTIFETDETVLWFLAVDPDGKHELGEPLRWQNKLNLTHQPKTVLGKRTVELTVRPRGQIRWNTTGINPKDGEVYDGTPIEIPGDDEVTIYAYAEDQGVSVTRNFKIPKADGAVVIDKAKPATIKKKLSYDGNGPTFSTIKAAKDNKATFAQTVQIEVGKGARNAITRFGSDSVVTPETIEKLIEVARLALGDPTAEVKLTFGETRFNTGHDLEAFLTSLKTDVSTAEVEQ